MKHRSFFIFLILIFIFPVWVFSQQIPSAGVLRDFVGLINQSYHPGIVSYFEKMRTELEKSGQSGAVKAIDLFLKGATGSCFIIAGANGDFYALTNYHVIQQAHTLSITFERQDNFKRQYENLTVIAADEEADLALLAFPAGDKPSAGLSLLTRVVEEGEDVYAAGFPVLGVTPLWQFSRGMVSNSSAKFPKSIYDETLMGPYIQHTAQIDPGNSGGPLLVVQTNAVSGYTVAGINTLSGLGRQTANYAIPVSTARDFINGALNQKPENYRDALDKRLDQFVNGLGVNRAAYPHIAEYLSSFCVGENAEYAMSQMYDKGSASVRRAFIEKCEDSVVGAMGYAVAWTIENNIRGQGAIKASLKDITGTGEEYTVVFTINNKDISSIWIREYGNWRIKSFGSVASGDKALMNKKEADKKAKENLRIGSNNFHIQAGYASLFKKAPAAFYFSADYNDIGINLYYANIDFWSLGIFAGLRFGIPAGNLGFMPYARLGINFFRDQEYEDYKEQYWDVFLNFPVSFLGQLGLKITSSYVPGLFIGTGFQFNFFGMMGEYDNPMKAALSITAGYAF